MNSRVGIARSYLTRSQRLIWPTVVLLIMIAALGSQPNSHIVNAQESIEDQKQQAPSSFKPSTNGTHKEALEARRTFGSSATGNATPDLATLHEREFVSPQVRIQMDCQRDKTIVKLNFTRPFNGIIGAGQLDTTNCKRNGNGTKFYELRINHNETGCDAQWDSEKSSILNTLFVRFHSTLETGSDIAKNMMCRLTVGDVVVGRRPTRNQANRKRPSGNSSARLRPKLDQPTMAIDADSSSSLMSSTNEDEEDDQPSNLLSSDPILNLHSAGHVENSLSGSSSNP